MKNASIFGLLICTLILVPASIHGLKVGDVAPNFTGTDQHGNNFDYYKWREEHPGQKSVVAIFPSSGEGLIPSGVCTQQAKSIEAGYEELKKKNITPFMINLEDPQTHQKFAKRHGLTMSILTSPEAVESYGSTFAGAVTSRKTYSMDESGIIIDIINNFLSAEAHSPENIIKGFENSNQTSQD